MADNSFQLSGITFPGGDVDLFGVWAVTPAVAPEVSSVSFSVGTARSSTEVVWGADLPGSLTEAQALLRARQASVSQQQAQLGNIEQRLAQLVQGSGSVSFAVGASGPEADLLNLLNRYDPNAVSYGFFDRKKKDAEDQDEIESSQKWRGFLDQVRDRVLNYARITTAMAGSPLGNTAVGWTGDFKTVWASSVTVADMDLHYQNVNFSLMSRLAMLRFVGVVGAGAANVAVKLAVPGGQLLALPAVWRFVKDVLAEWHNLQALRTET